MNEAMVHESQLLDSLLSPDRTSETSETLQPSHSSREDKPEPSSRNVLENIMRALAKEVSRDSTQHKLRR